MILRAGSKTFEFRKTGEIRFVSAGDALSWLKHLGVPDANLISRLRGLLTLHADDPGNSRLTDDQVLERISRMLYSRRIVVIGQESGGGSAKPKEKGAPPAPPFPLSERASRKSFSSPVTTREPIDPPTFVPTTSAADQAAALVNAAAAGTPFCAECEAKRGEAA
jgi:hypothetical protein